MTNYTVEQLKTLYPTFTQAKWAYKYKTAKSWSSLCEWINGRQEDIVPNELYRFMGVNELTEAISYRINGIDLDWNYVFKMAVEASKLEDGPKPITFTPDGDTHNWVISSKECLALARYAAYKNS